MGIFAMPSLGADMEAGKLVEWMIAPGDEVHRGDVVAVVETQKGAIEIEIFEDGIVESLTADLGATLPVGAPLAVIRGRGEAVTTAPEPAPAALAPDPVPPPAPPAPPPVPIPVAVPAAPPAPATVPEPAPPPVAPVAVLAGGQPPASPAARAYAAHEGISLSGIVGTGPGGAVVLADVAGHAAPKAAIKPDSPMAAMRAAIAAAMSRSKREIPHYYLMHSVDLQAATDWLDAQNATREPQSRLLMGALFIKAAAVAARRAKGINGHYRDDRFMASDAVHAGVAVALRGGGLVAPAIHDADTLPLDDLMAAMRDVVFRARAGRLRSSEMQDGTITVSSLGEKGVEAMEGVIYPPQVALVGIGTPMARPWVVDGQVVARQVATLSLAADHRASDGRLGAKFLKDMETLLQSPEAL